MWWQKKKSNPGWQCRVCGKPHEGLPTDYGWKLPDTVWAQGETARQRHLEWATDVCHDEGRWYLRGVLELPFTFATGRWGWGCWAEVEEAAVQRLWALGDRDGSDEPPKPGTLACTLPDHPDSFGLPVLVQFGPAALRPLLVLSPESGHPLAAAQRHGIDEAAYHAILDSIGFIPDTPGR